MTTDRVSHCGPKRRGRDSNPRDPKVAGFQDRTDPVPARAASSVDGENRALSAPIREAHVPCSPCDSLQSGSKPGNTPPPLSSSELARERAASLVRQAQKRAKDPEYVLPSRFDWERVDGPRRAVWSEQIRRTEAPEADPWP